MDKQDEIDAVIARLDALIAKANRAWRDGDEFAAAAFILAAKHMIEAGRIGNTEGEFSVAQFFSDGTHEYVRRWVGPREAVEAVHHCTTSRAAQAGVVVRVIVTDGSDFTNFEWRFGEGVTYPPVAASRREVRDVAG